MNEKETNSKLTSLICHLFRSLGSSAASLSILTIVSVLVVGRRLTSVVIGTTVVALVVGRGLATVVIICVVVASWLPGPVIARYRAVRVASHRLVECARRC